MRSPIRHARALVLLLLALLMGTAQAWPKPASGPASARTNITRSVRQFLKGYQRDEALRALPADASQYRYVLVKGLYGNNYPGYMRKNLRALKDRGLDAEFAPIDTGGSIRANAAVLKRMIKRSDKPIVFIAHSKGVADVTQAVGQLHAANPALVQSQVRGLVSLQGAYGGSPVADLLASSKLGRRLIRVISWVFGARPAAVYDLQTAKRHAFTAASPMPTDVVPTISMLGYKTSYWSLLAPGIALLKRGFGAYSDGLVGHGDAVISGSDVVRLPIDHAQAAFGKYSERLTLGLVTHLLTMPRSRL